MCLPEICLRELEDTFGRRDTPHAWVDGNSGTDRPGDGFVDRLNTVMRVRPADEIDVEVDACVIGQTAEELLRESRREGADHLLTERGAENEKRAPRKVDGSSRECFVHRDVCGSESRDSRFVIQCFCERLSEADADILDGVVGIHLEIPTAHDLEVKLTVSGKGNQHVVEKSDPGFRLTFAGSIDVEIQSDVCFGCLPVNSSDVCEFVGCL